ncbi:carbon monoxide dehydrogenase subunit G [Oxyplasma meridianum]|uniref:Carbon monoxide dehydrogenase subunit G n=1 Tax=Oxyplasma meridianum TaxID=3073602 RepID=A0AAX4NGV3_9ARCH
MDMDGTFKVDKSDSKVAAFLSDINKILSIMPDKESQEVVDSTNARFTAKAGVSFIKGKFDIRISLEEIKEDSIKITGAGSGKGGSVDFSIQVNHTPEDAGTDVKWKLTLNIRGTLATLGSRIIKSQAEKYAMNIIEEFKKALESI